MADQCIVCLDVLDNFSAESDSTNADLEPKSAKVALTALNLDSNTTRKGQNIAVIKTCGHILHDVCLQAWTEKANSCPICRSAFHLVEVYDKVDGNIVSTYSVEDKKQVADFDPAAWIDDQIDEFESTPCPICGSSDDEEVLLLCDACDAPYHTHCVGLDRVPHGRWFCIECVHEDVIARTQERRPDRQPRTWAQRTQAQVRQARRARTDDWYGAWNQITGRVYDATGLDFDYLDEDEALTNYRDVQRRTERERREFQQWQQRLNIAGRQGARDVFRAAAQPILNPREQPPDTPKQTIEEEKAWEAFENARESDLNSSSSRKRKATSITRSPTERSTEPERKLKRPKTRRVVNRPGSSSGGSSSNRRNSIVAVLSAPQTVPGPSIDRTSAPSFLSSLLKEVEMSTYTDDESAQILQGTSVASPSVGHSSPAVSPETSNYSTPRAMSTTPPPYRSKRPGSPLPLTSHVEPIYPPADYSPNRSPPEHQQSNSEKSGSISPTSHEIRQPRPQRKQPPIPRSEDSSPSRATISIAAKEGIQKIVRTALEPHYKKAAGITSEQYSNINRLVSRMLYEKIVNPDALDENEKSAWEKIATAEVTKAVEGLSA